MPIIVMILAYLFDRVTEIMQQILLHLLYYFIKAYFYEILFVFCCLLLILILILLLILIFILILVGLLLKVENLNEFERGSLKQWCEMDPQCRKCSIPYYKTFMLNRWVVVYDRSNLISGRNPIKLIYGVIKGAYIVQLL